MVQVDGCAAELGSDESVISTRVAFASYLAALEGKIVLQR